MRILITVIIIFNYLTLKCQSLEFIHYINSNMVYSIADMQDTLFLGTNGGLIKINKNTCDIIQKIKSNSNLPSNQIYVIKIDAKGNKWIGTNNGLVKISEGNWKIYNSDNSDLPSNSISDILIDDAGIKWICTSKGLVEFNDLEFTNYNSSNSGVNLDYLVGITLDNFGNKWIVSACEGSVVKYDGNNFYQFDSPFGCGGCATSICSDNDNSIWIGAYCAGLLKFDGDKWEIFHTYNSGIPSNRIRNIKCDLTGSVWIGADIGLIEYNGIDWKTFPNNSLLNQDIVALELIKKDSIYIGTLNGLVYFNGINSNHYNTSLTTLPDNFVEVLNIDHLENIWIGTHRGKGLGKFDRINWSVYDSILPMDFSITKTIKSENNGNIWIGTDEGLVLFNGLNHTIYNESNSDLPDNLINTIEIDNFSNKWIGTSSGVVKIDNSYWEVFTSTNSQLPNNYISKIIFNYLDNSIWIGTFGGGLAKLNGSNWITYSTINSDIPGNDIESLAIDNENQLWIGTSWNGLAVFDGINWTIFNDSFLNLLAFTITSIAIDEDNNKWIGTYGGGIIRIEGENWQVYNKSNSLLPSDLINDIIIDNFNNKWVAFDGEGIGKFINLTFNNTTDKKITRNHIKIIPNPNNGSFFLEIENNPHEKAEIEIFNISGEKIFYSQFIDQQMLTFLPEIKGLYILKITLKNEIFTEKVMIE
jgi:ligand-binding sensor domain-containing protein